jgi:hypothetical protein
MTAACKAAARSPLCISICRIRPFVVFPPHCSASARSSRPIMVDRAGGRSGGGIACLGVQQRRTDGDGELSSRPRDPPKRPGVEAAVERLGRRQRPERGLARAAAHGRRRVQRGLPKWACEIPLCLANTVYYVRKIMRATFLNQVEHASSCGWMHHGAAGNASHTSRAASSVSSFRTPARRP